MPAVWQHGGALQPEESPGDTQSESTETVLPALSQGVLAEQAVKATYQCDPYARNPVHLRSMWEIIPQAEFIERTLHSIAQRREKVTFNKLRSLVLNF